MSRVGNFWLRQEKPYRCYYCSTEISRTVPETAPNRATIDHYIPLTQGGKGKRNNKVAACFSCNQLKKNIVPTMPLKEAKGFLSATIKERMNRK